MRSNKEKGLLPKDSRYVSFFQDIKQRIQKSQIKAAVSINKELLLLYWDMGQRIVEKQKETAWGDGFLEQMSRDLQKVFPDMKGFSLRNLKYMRQWFLFWSDAIISQQVADQMPIGQQAVAQLQNIQQAAAKSPIVQQVVAQLPNALQVVAQIPWGHNLVIISKIKTHEEALFYVQKTIQNNWSRAVLVHHIEGNLFKREGKAVTNFKTSLPEPQSDLALQTIKDPYNFDFLNLREKHDEKELEEALMEQVTRFLLELGAGFSFIGQQQKISVEGDDFYIDLLFYHTKLHCYVVVELKASSFKPEYAGKLNFYVSVVDSLMKTDEDNPSLGILICKSKKKTVVEYSLRGIHTPIG